jgi:hypothetical protein
MQGNFYLTACAALAPKPGKTAETCEIGTLVKHDFILNLDLVGLYSKVLTQCIKKLGTSRINLLSIEIASEKGEITLQANIILAKDETGNKELDEVKTTGQDVDLSGVHSQLMPGDLRRLYRYMELFAQREVGRKFERLASVRMSKADADDIPAENF